MIFRVPGIRSSIPGGIIAPASCQVLTKENGLVVNAEADPNSKDSPTGDSGFADRKPVVDCRIIAVMSAELGLNLVWRGGAAVLLALKVSRACGGPDGGFQTSIPSHKT